jgi:hypothetical protein
MALDGKRIPPQNKNKTKQQEARMHALHCIALQAAVSALQCISFHCEPSQWKLISVRQVVELCQ